MSVILITHRGKIMGLKSKLAMAAGASLLATTVNAADLSIDVASCNPLEYENTVAVLQSRSLGEHNAGFVEGGYRPRNEDGTYGDFVERTLLPEVMEQNNGSLDITAFRWQEDVFSPVPVTLHNTNEAQQKKLHEIWHTNPNTIEINGTEVPMISSVDTDYCYTPR